eukprot:1188427-Prymnesium_polylepis.1
MGHVSSSLESSSGSSCDPGVDGVESSRFRQSSGMAAPLSRLFQYCSTVKGSSDACLGSVVGLRSVIALLEAVERRILCKPALPPEDTTELQAHQVTAACREEIDEIDDAQPDRRGTKPWHIQGGYVEFCREKKKKKQTEDRLPLNKKSAR